jgi:hypothetical protein
MATLKRKAGNMNKQEDSTTHSSSGTEKGMPETGNRATREDEQGDVAEPDAPTDVEENPGMNTILGGGLGTGVQTDAGDE